MTKPANNIEINIGYMVCIIATTQKKAYNYTNLSSILHHHLRASPLFLENEKVAPLYASLA